MFKSISLAFLLASAHMVSAALSGNGIIYVLHKTEGVSWADPNNKAGCLSKTGKVIKPQNEVDCGVYTIKSNTLYTSEGRCTWLNAAQPQNTDSIYGRLDHSWSCGTAPGNSQDINENFYTLNNAAPYYLGYGDVDFSYDAKKLPGTNENLDVWPYRWGSQQMGITPGHVELQWLWVPV